MKWGFRRAKTALMMGAMAWPEKTGPSTDASEKRTLGEGVFQLCEGCGATVTAEQLEANFRVCPQCGHHHRLAADRWRALICDEGALDAWAEHLSPTDPLEFSDGKSYVDRIASAQKKTGTRDAIEVGRAKLQSVGRVMIPLLVVFGPDGQEVFKSDAYTVGQVLDAVERAGS